VSLTVVSQTQEPIFNPIMHEASDLGDMGAKPQTFKCPAKFRWPFVVLPVIHGPCLFARKSILMNESMRLPEVNDLQKGL